MEKMEKYLLFVVITVVALFVAYFTFMYYVFQAIEISDEYMVATFFVSALIAGIGLFGMSKTKVD